MYFTVAVGVAYFGWVNVCYLIKLDFDFRYAEAIKSIITSKEHADSIESCTESSKDAEKLPFLQRVPQLIQGSHEF